MKPLFFLLPILIVAGCVSKHDGIVEQSVSGVQKDSSSNPKGFDKLKESFNEDVLPDEYRKDILKPIQDNFKRINTIPNKEWSLIFSKDLDEPGEGGVATFYFYNDSLSKIVARHYGEMGQMLVEYYLLNGKLSFVLEKSINYNRPFNYDAAQAKENGDSVAFDIDKSEITEDRSYFKDGVLLHQVNNQDCGAPFANEYLAEEQKRILTEFKSLSKLSKKY